MAVTEVQQTQTRSSTGRHGRLVANVVDQVAAEQPTRPYAYVPCGTTPEQGWEPVTYSQIATAVNYVARKVEAKVKKTSSSGEPFPTLAYIGSDDLRYAIVMLACIKAGCKALYISPRNSLEGQLSLFEHTACSHLWHAKSHAEATRPWKQARPDLEVEEMESLEALLSLKDVKHFPYQREFLKARFEPAVVLHTSGSTGIPKPIVVRQGTLSLLDGSADAPTYKGRQGLFKTMTGMTTRIFTPMPFYHAAGFMGTLMKLAALSGCAPALPIPDRPMTPELALKCIQYSGADGTFLPPSILEEMMSTDDYRQRMKCLKAVCFGGGNLSKTAGDAMVKQNITLFNMIGSTEMMPYALYHQSNQELWQYFIMNSESMGAHWICHDQEEGIYELTVRRKDANDPLDQPAFYTFPNVSEWSTGDLYRKHPTLPDHWIYHGRADNIIVFSNGEKLNPVTIEDTVVGHPDVKGAVVVGEQRLQPALILEPRKACKTEAEQEAFIDAVWPVIEEVNKATVAHGQIVRRYVAVSDPNMPFLRASKGTVQRAGTIKEYADFIDQLYERADEIQHVHDIASLNVASHEGLMQSIMDIFHEKLGVEHMDPDSDFFTMGVDSLQVLNLSNMLRSSLKATGFPVDRKALAARYIYANPTPKSLGAYLYSLVRGDAAGKANGSEVERETETLRQLVAKYTRHLPAKPATAKPDPQNVGQTVLLTGTTGSLGAYMLDMLCASPNVAKVVAMNRGADGGRSRQGEVCESRGLHPDMSKIEFLGVDLSQANFGLSEAKYDELLASADRIIHNSWPVNFNMGVASFEPHIRGVRHFIDFSAAAAKNVALIYISSIGTVARWNRPGESVPEQRLEDLNLAHMGYGRSKLASCLIIDEAARQSGIPAASVRVGQIAGPRAAQGQWNKQELPPTMIASSLYLGMLPESIGARNKVDWVPVEDVANIVTDVAGVTNPATVHDISGYFHAVNPQSTSWDKLAPAIVDFYRGRITKLVPIQEWVAALEKSATGPNADTAKNPAIKLLDSFREMVPAGNHKIEGTHFAMQRTMGRSPTVATLEAVTPEIMQHWCAQWQY